MHLTLRRSFAVVAAALTATATMTTFSTHKAFADGPGCVSAGGNGVCISGPGISTPAETVPSETIGGSPLNINNPLPFPVCYAIGCVPSGGTLASVPIPQETTPSQTVPSQNVPVTVELGPAVAVAAPGAPSFTFTFFALTEWAPGTYLYVDWGDGVRDSTEAVSFCICGLQMSHAYAPGLHWMTTAINNNGPVEQAVYCLSTGCTAI